MPRPKWRVDTAPAAPVAVPNRALLRCARLKRQRPLVRLLGLAWSYRGASALFIGAQVLRLLLGLCAIRLSGLAVDVARHALDDSSPAPRWPFAWTPPAGLDASGALIGISVGVLAVAAVRALVGYRTALGVGRLLHLRLVPQLRTRVFNRMARLSFRFFDENASGSIINRLTGDVQLVRSFMDGALFPLVGVVLSLAIAIGYMVRSHPLLTAACFAPAPVVWFISYRFSRWALPAYRAGRVLSDDLVLAMSEGVAGIQVTKMFGNEVPELERFRRRNRAIVERQRAVTERVSRFGPTVAFLSRVNVIILLVAGGSLVASGGMTLGDLIVFAALLQQSSDQIAATTGIMNTLQQSLAAAARVFEVLDTPLTIASPTTAPQLPPVRGEIRFAGVSFAYDEGRPVLHNINFQVAAGKHVAIFGATGAGKSTLLELIPRFHDVSAGQVLIDEVDVRMFDLAMLRRSIGPVFQENVLFRCSIAENIAFGHPEASREQIERAARGAGVHEFITGLPAGYDTLVEEGAANLSGGQRQRIAIARALLPEPAILLLDDPTSAVDAETEHEVMEALTEAIRGRTALIVAHRLTTLRRADQILVLQDGRIVQRGTHEQLIAEPGVYLQAASLQAPDASVEPPAPAVVSAADASDRTIISPQTFGTDEGNRP
jgi:ATP-binding cassette subfamily B protein